jgi:CHAD domain-containing protein
VPRRQRRWFKKSLRRIRRAAGEARDLDVLTMRCRAAAAARPPAAGGAARKHLADMLAKKRPPTRRELEDEITNLLARDWNGQAAALLVAIESAATTETIVSFARRRSRRLVRRFLAHLDHCLHDDREIHRLRVHPKKLRYSLELFTAAAPTAEVTACVRGLRRLQARLGEFTDHAAAAERLRLWSQGEADDRARRTLVDASRQESALAKQARRGCIRW